MAFLDETGLAELWSLVKGEDEKVKSLANTKAQIAYGSYTGTGKSGSANKNTLNFGFVPRLVIVAYSGGSGLNPAGGSWTSSFIWSKGQKYAYINGTGATCGNEFTQSGNTLSWYNTYGNSSTAAVNQLNGSSLTYDYLAIG